MAGSPSSPFFRDDFNRSLVVFGISWCRVRPWLILGVLTFKHELDPDAVWKLLLDRLKRFDRFQCRVLVRPDGSFAFQTVRELDRDYHLVIEPSQNWSREQVNQVRPRPSDIRRGKAAQQMTAVKSVDISALILRRRRRRRGRQYLAGLYAENKDLSRPLWKVSSQPASAAGRRARALVAPARARARRHSHSCCGYPICL